MRPELRACISAPTPDAAAHPPAASAEDASDFFALYFPDAPRTAEILDAAAAYARAKQAEERTLWGLALIDKDRAAAQDCVLRDEALALIDANNEAARAAHP